MSAWLDPERDDLEGRQVQGDRGAVRHSSPNLTLEKIADDGAVDGPRGLKGDRAAPPPGFVHPDHQRAGAVVGSLDCLHHHMCGIHRDQ